MNHPVYRVQSFDIVGPYTLCVRFDDNTTQTVDFQPVLAGELYGPLRDLELFNQVRIDPEAETLVWPNGADHTVPPPEPAENPRSAWCCRRNVSGLCKEQLCRRIGLDKLDDS